ncbi:hypothetical protein Agabi119p4_10095 [Agaricus bisporus var. burnettii]|uniref:F-box domain-containing protein n=1 Tax=Agaricus bisporus var. burnettii TaxID=192524 RepID=A0A8H7C2C1_AGABI|nr:hypothetical protein Agabi119p4_10095 [Agaricus bisporus var. burnettii]
MLCDLPFEIFSEIVSYLSYKDILVLRQILTHKDLCDATNAHVVWLNLAKEYVAENPHSHFSNTHLLSSLTTNQIRERFEKRLLVNHLWQSPGKVYPTTKRLKKPSPTLLSVAIAPGGRWLFAGTKHCSLYYWDLDSDDPEPVHLVPCDDVGNTPGENNTITAIDFLVERDDPLSGFTLAFIGRDCHCEHKESGEWLYIWDVVPQDASGTLKAKRLRTIPLPYYGLPSQFSFNGHLVACSMTKRLDVYWWRECTETQLVRCTLVLETDPIITSVYVIGSDKLLVYTRYQHNEHKAQLYTLEPEYSDVSEPGKAVSHATEIWSFCFCSQCHGYKTSRLYFDGANYYQIIAMVDGIYSLTIPASQADDAAATLTKVSNFNLHQRHHDTRIYGLGLSKGCCRVGAELYRFGYSIALTGGSYEHVVTFEAGIDRILQRLDEVLSYDEELGRLISVTFGHLIIQDFSLPVYNPADVCPDSDAWTSSQYWS